MRSFAGRQAPCGLSTSAPGSRSNVAARPQRRSTAAAALPEWLRSLVDFESWAPKSTRIWRLNHYEYPESKPDEVDELEARINRQRQASTSYSNTTTTTSSTAAADADPLAQLPPTGSFSEADDASLSRALSARLQTLTQEEEEQGQGQGEEEKQASAGALEEDVPELTGPEMRQLLYTKYGKTYDVSFVRRDIPGKTFVGLNIMWQHLEQRSFRLTEEQYNEKLDSVAYLLTILGQAKKVRTFLQQPARSVKGLPRRPVVGTAIFIQLELTEAQIKEFFSFGYQ